MCCYVFLFCVVSLDRPALSYRRKSSTVVTRLARCCTGLCWPDTDLTVTQTTNNYWLRSQHSHLNDMHGWFTATACSCILLVCCRSSAFLLQFPNCHVPDANFARQLILHNYAYTGSHSAVPVTPSAILVSSSKYTGGLCVLTYAMMCSSSHQRHQIEKFAEQDLKLVSFSAEAAQQGLWTEEASLESLEQD